MWKVGGIEKERATGRQKKLRVAKGISEKRKFFSLRAVTRKRKEIL